MKYLNIRGLAVMSLLLVLTVSVQGQSAQLLKKLGERPLHIAAHRGGHQQLPENSLAAIDAAIAQGATIVELDVRSTKDGVLLLMHDKTVDRTTSGKGLISELTFAEVQQLYLRDEPRGKLSQHRVPTFEEALRACKGKVILDIDFKEERKEYIGATCALIAKEGMEDEVLFFLYDHADLAAVHAINPRITLFPRAHNEADVQAILQTKLASIIHIDESFTASPAMKSWAAAGVYFWINSLKEVDERAEKKGEKVYKAFLDKYPFVKIVQTDNPRLWKQTLVSYKNK